MPFSRCSVKGLEDEEQEEGQLLGQYVYQEDGDALQTYPVTVRENAPHAQALFGLNSHRVLD